MSVCSGENVDRFVNGVALVDYCLSGAVIIDTVVPLVLGGYLVNFKSAVPTLKETANVVTKGSRGDGVIELIERLLADEFTNVATPTFEIPAVK